MLIFAGMRELETVHGVADSPADAIGQWFNAGGMIQFYDYSLEVFMNVRHFTRCYGPADISRQLKDWLETVR